MRIQIQRSSNLVKLILLLGLVIASGCSEVVTANSPSQVDSELFVQAPASEQSFNSDSLSMTVEAAISATTAVQHDQITIDAEPTESPEPKAAVIPVVIPTATTTPPTPTPTARVSPTQVLFRAPTDVSEPTVVAPTPTLTPSPTAVLPTPTLTPLPTTVPPTVIPAATPAPLSVDELVEASSSAVVKITSSAGVGAGVIFRLVNNEALVLTNQHLVGSATSVTVRVNDTSDFAATIVATDRSRDLAVVRICCSSNYLALDLASPDEIVRGESVVVFGYPLGSNSLHASQGVVSGIEFDANSDRDVIHTDAAIEVGDSGGPLLLMTGQIAGISTREMIATNFGIPTEGLGSVISVSSITEVVDTMVSGINVPSSALELHPEIIDGKYTSPMHGYEVPVPSGWILDTSDPHKVSMWDKYTGTTILVRRAGDSFGFVDTAHWHQYWTYVGQTWQQSINNIDESNIFRTYAGNTGGSDSLQGLEFRNTFELNGELYRDFTQVYYEQGTVWFVSLFVSNQLWVQPEYAEYRLTIKDAASSFHPPFTE